MPPISPFTFTLAALVIGVVILSIRHILAAPDDGQRTGLDRATMIQVLNDLLGQYNDKDPLWQAVAPYATALKAQYAFQQLWEQTHADG